MAVDAERDTQPSRLMSVVDLSDADKHAMARAVTAEGKFFFEGLDTELLRAVYHDKVTTANQ